MSAGVSDALCAQDVIVHYHELMGVPVRFVSGDMHATAARYVRAGFTLDDMSAVIGYLKRQIRRAEEGERGTGGWNRASLRWGKLFEQLTEGDEGLQRFADLLTLALAEAPKKIAPKAAPAGERQATDEERAEMSRKLRVLKGGGL